MPEINEVEANKKLVRDYIGRVFNGHNPQKAAEFVTGDVVWHGGGLGEVTGAQSLVGLLESFIGALPNLNAVEQDLIAENDLVVVRLIVRNGQGHAAGRSGRRQADPLAAGQ